MEFNPYEKYKSLSPRHPDTVIKSEYVEHHNSKIQVVSSPGFAPAVQTQTDSVRFPYEYNKLYYGAVNWCYQCSIYPHETKSGDPHTGVDLAGTEGTPIYSFITGEVWATSYMGNTGGSAGAHLHVEVFECDNNIKKENVINEDASENIEMKWVDNREYWNRKASRVDPFNHNEHRG